MNSINNVSICIPADVKHVRATVSKILLFLKENNIRNENFTFETKVVLNEIIVNSIIHGNNSDNSKNVSIQAGICKNKHLYAVIADQGDGSCCIKDPCKEFSSDDFVDVCDIKESGRGLQIAKAFCDCVRCNKRGNIFIIKKRLPEM